ncbi:MAG: S-adenosylmethionine decarboxylase proenzyme [Candidatus Methanoperedenaceae archaeon GB50]|nr:MAG: S-adenosylmethionine decarboxylase proenzyme [Candidatus Methanoperedenaceae archaeon GB50]HEC50110.1 adenosylmethionine decarboxylase [Candidatus Desulfofervidus auxilii]
MAWMGKHLILELWGCNGRVLNSEMLIKGMLEKAVEVSGTTLVELKTHKFNPQGLSAVALLKESYMSIHSWPEIGYAAIDIYTCVPYVRPEEVVSVVKQYLKPKKMHVLDFHRGDSYSDAEQK